MSVGALTMRPFIPPVYSLEHPLDQVEETRKKVLPFIADTVAPAIVLTEPVQQNPTTFFGRPKLEHPSKEAFNAAQFQQEMEDVYQNVMATGEQEDLSDQKDHNALDIWIAKMMVKCYSNQRELGQENEIITTEDVDIAKRQMERLRKEHFDIKDDINDRKSTTEKIAWIDTGLALGIIASSLVVFFNLSTSGLFTLAIGGLSIARGLTFAAKGILDYTNNKLTGALYKVNTLQSDLQEQMEVFLNMMMEAMQGVCTNWKDQREISAHRLEASRFN